jgi:hypothetical protein
MQDKTIIRKGGIFNLTNFYVYYFNFYFAFLKNSRLCEIDDLLSGSGGKAYGGNRVSGSKCSVQRVLPPNPATPKLRPDSQSSEPTAMRQSNDGDKGKAKQSRPDD